MKITVLAFLFRLFVEMLFWLHCSLKFEEYAIKKMKPFFYSVLHLIPIQHVIYFVYTNLRRTHMYELVMSVNCNTDWYIFMALVMRLIIMMNEPMAVLDLKQPWIFNCTYNIFLTKHWNWVSSKYNLATSFDLVTHKLNYLKTLKYITDMSRTSSCLTIIITTTMLYSYTLSTDYNDFSERSYCSNIWKHKWLMILTWSSFLFWNILIEIFRFFQLPL